MKTLLTVAAFFVVSAASAQSVNRISSAHKLVRNNTRAEIIIPDIAGYQSLKGDFHLHTIFSDGSVMPADRVAEAWTNGLDVIAITDHIEYRPNKDFVLGDHNRSYEMAKKSAQDMGILLVKASELTTDKPKGGHINALFVTDSNPLERAKDSPDLTTAVDEAVRQGAYLLWNHPGWAIDSCIMFPLNEKWIKEGKIKGVEVFNETDYYPRAATWVNEMKITPFANTDAHGMKSDFYRADVYPPFNIVLARERTLEGVREAMFAGRVIAVFDGQAVATPELLKALFEACVEFKHITGDNYEVTNISDIPFDISSKQLSCKLMPRTTMRFKAKGSFAAEITNLHIDENSNLQVTIL